jgi:hypothetical protein
MGALLTPAAWDALPAAKRVAFLKRADASFRHPAYAGLLARMAVTPFANLTPLQRAAIAGKS